MHINVSVVPLLAQPTIHAMLKEIDDDLWRKDCYRNCILIFNRLEFYADVRGATVDVQLKAVKITTMFHRVLCISGFARKHLSFAIAIRFRHSIEFGCRSSRK